MSYVTLKGGDLLTQNCSSVTVVRNWVWSLILVNCVKMWIWNERFLILTI